MEAVMWQNQDVRDALYIGLLKSGGVVEEWRGVRCYIETYWITSCPRMTRDEIRYVSSLDFSFRNQEPHMTNIHGLGTVLMTQAPKPLASYLQNFAFPAPEPQKSTQSSQRNWQNRVGIAFHMLAISLWALRWLLGPGAGNDEVLKVGCKRFRACVHKNSS